MVRILVFNRGGDYIGDVDEKRVVSAKLHEEVNGEHSLTLVTTQNVAYGEFDQFSTPSSDPKGARLVFNVPHNGEDKWREYIVAGVDSDHHIDGTIVYTYYCVWSIQEELQCVIVSAMPGIQTPVTAQDALAAILAGQTRWTVGTVTNTATGGASMYDRSAWDALSTLIETWGGEIDMSIAISQSSQRFYVSNRIINYYDAIGSSEAVHRFDFGFNLSQVRRSVDDAPYYSRITPRGKGEATENGGYGRKITIESVNYGRDYLVYDNGYKFGDVYPTLKVENSNCETPAELKTWAEGVIGDYCVPKVTYTVNAHKAFTTDGFDDGYTDISLGDVVQVVDEFFEGGLRFESRVMSVDIDLVDDSMSTVQISNAAKSVATKFSNLGSGGTNYSQPSVSSAIGGVEPVSTSSISVPDSTSTDICSISLPPGVWIVTGLIVYEMNATGRRSIRLSTTSRDQTNVPSHIMQLAVPSAATRISTTRCFTLANQATVYLVGGHGAGTTLTCSGKIEATKIG